VVGCGGLLGFLGETGCWTRCFGGEFVVDCVVNVVSGRTRFFGVKRGTGVSGLFLGWVGLGYPAGVETKDRQLQRQLQTATANAGILPHSTTLRVRMTT